MAEPFIGEVRIFSFNFAPRGWALCAGQLLPINQNQALFSLLGTTFGGNGQTTFALPDFRGRTPIHSGGGFVLGQSGGEESHTLTIPEMAAHTHTPAASSNAPDNGIPTGRFWSGSGNQTYSTTQNASMNAAAIGGAGGSQAHPNMQPYTVLNFCIALQGIFPSPN